MIDDEMKNCDAMKFIANYVLMQKEGLISIAGVMSLVTCVMKKYNLNDSESVEMINYAHANIDFDCSDVCVYVEWKKHEA